MASAQILLLLYTICIMHITCIYLKSNMFTLKAETFCVSEGANMYFKNGLL